MKTVCLLALLTQPVFGFTIHQGFSQSEWVGSDTDLLGYQSMTPRPGYHVGLSHTLAFNRLWAVRLGAANVPRGFQAHPAENRRSSVHIHDPDDHGYNMDFVEVNALSQFGPETRIGKVYVLLGPQIALRRSCDSRSGGNYSCKGSETLNFFDYGVQWGAGTRIRVFQGIALTVDVLYTQGLRSVLNYGTGDRPISLNHGVRNIRHRTILLQVGLGPFKLSGSD